MTVTQWPKESYADSVWQRIAAQAQDARTQTNAQLDQATSTQAIAVQHARTAARQAREQLDQARAALQRHEQITPTDARSWAAQRTQLAGEVEAYQRIDEKARATLQAAQEQQQAARQQYQQLLTEQATAQFRRVEAEVTAEIDTAARALAAAQERGRARLQQASEEYRRVTSSLV